MLKFRGSAGVTWDGAPFIAKIAEGDACSPNGFSLCRAPCPQPEAKISGLNFNLYRNGNLERTLNLSPHLNYLSAGDIVKVSPSRGSVKTLYRKKAGCNVIFTTERCNSNCIMCSQPPRDVDDGFLVDDYLQAIPLMDTATKELGISGGEPTLLGERFFELIKYCQKCLPNTGIHILTNGKSFSNISLCRKLADIEHRDLMLGIPLYSDIASRHDFVVQSHGAFNSTVRGLLNLSRYGVPIEIRIVLHAQTVARLPQLAQFIAQNFPFVQQVAFMGLEMMGYVKMNLPALWVDPGDYQNELAEAISFIEEAKIRPMIYNHQLCTLPRHLWKYSKKSISDWKNEFAESCQTCTEKSRCGGFFSSAKLHRSRLISPIGVTHKDHACVTSTQNPASHVAADS